MFFLKHGVVGCSSVIGVKETINNQ